MEGCNWSEGGPTLSYSIVRQMKGCYWSAVGPIVRQKEGSDWSDDEFIVRQIEGSDWSEGETIVRQMMGSDWSASGSMYCIVPKKEALIGQQVNVYCANGGL